MGIGFGKPVRCKASQQRSVKRCSRQSVLWSPAQLPLPSGTGLWTHSQPNPLISLPKLPRSAFTHPLYGQSLQQEHTMAGSAAQPVVVAAIFKGCETALCLTSDFQTCNLVAPSHPALFCVKLIASYSCGMCPCTTGWHGCANLSHVHGMSRQHVPSCRDGQLPFASATFQVWPVT